MSGMPPTFMLAAPSVRPRPPAWVVDYFDVGNDAADEVIRTPELPVVSRRTERFSLLKVEIDNAVALPGGELVDAVSMLYRSLSSELQRQQRHAIRVWNFVPDIQGHVDGGDRYMTFNIGRFAAYRAWFGSADAFPSSLPTASAVGVAGGTLSVYVLAAAEPGYPIENPRQVPSYYYSSRYGICPPCFSRATRLGSTLLIGGTASILGQHTLHEDNIGNQAIETCRNIAALIRAAAPDSAEPALKMLQSLRVHVLKPDHAADVHALLAELIPQVHNVEFVQAPLCRRELLVEIEGVAALHKPSNKW